MTPMRVGRNPLQNPFTPSTCRIRRAIWIGAFPEEASSPYATLDVRDDCICDLITSKGLVIQDAIVPATPPAKKLKDQILD